MQQAGHTIRIVVAEPMQFILESICSMINQQPQMTVVGMASNSRELRHIVELTQPDLVVTEIEYDDRSGVDSIKDIKRYHPRTKIVIFASRLCTAYLGQALKIGVHGFLLKSEPPKLFIDSLDKVLRGEQCFSETIRKCLDYSTDSRSWELNEEFQLEPLTPRQLEVLRQIAEGHSVKEIARNLHLSEKSVDSHKYRIMHKLKIHDRVKLTRYALKEGLVD